MNGCREIRFYYPYPRFPSVSVTGSKCGLNCKHCSGHYLEQMADVSSPIKLRKFCRKLEKNGGTGLLVSGGSTIEGKVPLKHFFETIRWVKNNTSLIINVHTGIVERSEAEEISTTGVDIVSVDIVGDVNTIRDVYGLNYSVKEYADTLFNLKDAGIPNIVPHICVGLDYGKILGEYKAVDIAGRINPKIIVILGLIPTKDTPMQDVKPPSNKDILDIIDYTQKIYPKTEISLGCMRSRINKRELEWLAIEAGVDRIATASHSTIERAKKQGYKVNIIDGCCSIPKKLEYKALRDD